MKLKLKFILLPFFVFLLYQEDVTSQIEDSLYTQVDSFPDFKYKFDTTRTIANLGRKIIEYYQENSDLKILKSRNETGAYTGLIILKFIVEKDGSITNVVVEPKGLKTDKDLLHEILMKTGIWIPGYIKGEPVRTSLTFLIYVNLE